MIEELVDIKKNKLKVIILDISYQGSFFDISDFLERFKSSNVVIFVVRSLLKLDQQGLEFTNAGIVEVFIPKHLEKLHNFVESELNKYRNALGISVSFYVYSLLENSLTVKDRDYARLVIQHAEDFYSTVEKDCRDNSDIEIVYNEGVLFIFLRLVGKKKEGYEEFLENLKYLFGELDVPIYARNSFGFRNLTVEYFGILDTHQYVFKICPGVYKGASYHLMQFLLKNYTSDLMLSERWK